MNIFFVSAIESLFDIVAACSGSNFGVAQVNVKHRAANNTDFIYIIKKKKHRNYKKANTKFDCRNDNAKNPNE